MSIDDGFETDYFSALENEPEEDIFDKLDQSPEAYDVPHSEWRPSQWDAFQYATTKFNEGEKFAILELPTGTGKSALPTAFGRDYPVLVLVHTLSLLDQYEERYGFSIVKGTQAYDCILPEKVELWHAKYGKIPKVSDCNFDKMSDCPVGDECPYIVARNKAMLARRMGCTYRYAAVAGLVGKRPGIVVLDEAHSAADEILSMEEMKVNEYDRKEFNLPAFPFTFGYGQKNKDGDPVGGLLTVSAKRVLLDWVMSCCNLLSKINVTWDPEYLQKHRSMYNKLYRIASVINEVEWFMEAGPGAIEHWYKGHMIHIPGIRLRPLSAKGIAKRLWNNKKHALLMSATIGNPVPLATELGMDEYSFQSYPHPTPPAYRPVYDLQMEKMIYDKTSNNPEQFRIQAQKIVKFVNKWPQDWRGIILTSSYEKIRQLRKYLTPAIGNRLANHGEASDMKEWLEARRKGEIAIQTMQGWGHGIDLHDDLARFMVMASVPFKNPTDPYEKVRQSAYGNSEYFWWSCYVTVPQATGRVSRGEQDKNGNWMLNTAALADGSALTGPAKRFYPKWFLEAIIPWKE